MAVVWDRVAFGKYYRTGAERWGYPNTRPQITFGYMFANIISAQMGTPINGLDCMFYTTQLFNALGMKAGDSVVMIGPGFNGTGAGLELLGVDVIGLETSDYILGEAGNTEEEDLRDAIKAAGLDPDIDKVRGPRGPGYHPLDLWMDGGRASPRPRGKGTVIGEDMSNRGSRNLIKNALASSPRFVISERVLDSIPDAEALEVCDLAARFAAETGAAVVHMLSAERKPGLGNPDLNWKTYRQWRLFLDSGGFQAQLILPSVAAQNQGMSLPGTLAEMQAYIQARNPKKPAQAVAAFAEAAINSNMVFEYSGLF